MEKSVDFRLHSLHGIPWGKYSNMFFFKNDLVSELSTFFLCQGALSMTMEDAVAKFGITFSFINFSQLSQFICPQ
jgi:hypothetical protein